MAVHSPADRFHSDAELSKFLGQPLTIPYEVFLEFVGVMLRRTSSRTVSSLVASLLQGPFNVRNESTPAEVGAWIEKRDDAFQLMRRQGLRPLSPHDLILLGLSQRLRQPILTFDEGIRFAARHRMFTGALLA